MREAALNLGWLIGEKAVRLVLNVGVGFWVARYLGPARFGELNYVIAVVGLVSAAAELGLESVVRREIIRAPERAGTVVAAAAGLRLAGGAAGYALLLAAAAGWANEGDRTLFAVAGLMLFQPALTVVDLWFQARLQARITVFAQLTALVLGAALRAGLIVTRASLVAFAAASVAEFVTAAALLWWRARRDGLAAWPKAWSGSVARRLLGEAWPLLLSSFAVLTYVRIDAVMLRQMAGEGAVGIYTAATRFTEIWFFLPVALAGSVLPSILRARERGAEAYAARLQGYFDLSAGLGFAIAIATTLAAPGLIRLAYGPAFAEAAPVLALHIWSTVFVFLGVARSQFLVNESFTRFYFAATAAGAVLNVALNFALIPRLGAWGAALATLAAQAVAAWASSFWIAGVRPTGRMQTRALLLPVRWITYARRA